MTNEYSGSTIDDDRPAKGQALRGRLFGTTADSENPRPRPAGVPERVQRQTNDHLFGDVWQNEAMTVEEHSLVTCAVLVATGRSEQLRGHLRGARNLGIGRDKLEAMIEHVMHYAGWPVGMTAFRVLNETWDEA